MAYLKTSILVLLFSVCLLSEGCKYSLKGVSIPPDVNTFYVNEFDVQASNAPASINIEFTQTLTRLIQAESRLRQNDEDPDVEFRGTITQYAVSSEAPLPGENVSFNRLTIGVRVEYWSNLNDEQIFEKNFSQFLDFDADENILDIQDDLIEEIYEFITEKVFREAFSDW